jgi:hypothetical protein
VSGLVTPRRIDHLEYARGRIQPELTTDTPTPIVWYLWIEAL